MHAWVEEAVGQGAQLLCGGQALSPTCYAPTVLLEPPPDCRVSTHEVFGPVVCVYGYEDLDEAIGRANALPWVPEQVAEVIAVANGHQLPDGLAGTPRSTGVLDRPAVAAE